MSWDEPAETNTASENKLHQYNNSMHPAGTLYEQIVKLWNMHLKIQSVVNVFCFLSRMQEGNPVVSRDFRNKE